MTIDNAIKIYANSHENGLHKHPNPTAIQLLDSGNDAKRFKRMKQRRIQGGGVNPPKFLNFLILMGKKAEKHNNYDEPPPLEIHSWIRPWNEVL